MTTYDFYLIIYTVFLILMKERGVDSADLIAFLLELSFHVTGKVLLDRASTFWTNFAPEL